ncbi:MAG: copper chaperone PCu(A)C [Alphaproteobacteria bacterium]|nr:copper chaperone PCu(A)C [Alphaproteobacteria bacterium]
MLSLMVLAAVAGATPPPMTHYVGIANPWFRALPSHLPAGGYFELRNTGQWTANLTAVDSPACGMLMMHKSEQKSGMDTMTDVSSVEIPAGQTVKFAPGSYHLMCMEPGPTVKPGNSVPVTLKFSDGSAATVRFAVRTATGH